MAEEGQNAGAIVAVAGDAPQSASGAIVAVSDVRIAGFDLKEVRAIASQTKAIGIILPPPDIRAIVDKTANFVAKHGPEFEKRILANEKGNVKFNFLNPTDPYHAYYQLRIKNFQEGQDGQAAPSSAAAEAAAKAAAQQVIPHALAKLEKPEDEMYTVHVPEGLTALELDVVKLAAQFVARNGKNFLTGLSSREHTNPQFNFLKPTHSLFGFFTALCDAYSRVLMPPKGTKDRLGRDAEDGAAVLERAVKRLEWERVRDKEMKDAADEAERERLAYQAIDWHDFVVVETIEFYDDEDDDLPPPLTLKDVVAMNKAREYAEAEDRAAAAAGAEAPKAAAMDAEERALVAQAAAVSLGGPSGVTAAPDTAPGMEAGAAGAAGAAQEEAEAEMELDDEDEGPIRVVKNYVRPSGPTSAAVGGRPYDPAKFAVSPITGELVPIAEMAEHMRVSLIDPRWKEQRDAMLARIRDTTKASDDEIGRNLLGLAKARPDVFGSTEEEVTQVVSESIREKLMSGTQRAVAWDGVTQRGPELAAQVAAIQQNRESMGMAPGPGGPGGPQGPGAAPRPPGMPMAPPAGMPAAPPPPRPPMPPGPPGGGMGPGPGGTMGAVAAARQAQMMAMQQQGGPGGAPPSLPPPPRPPMPPMGMPPMGMPPPPMGMPPGPPMGMRPPMPPGMPPGAPGGMGGPPAPPRDAPPPMPGDQPDAKRQRLDELFVLQPEDEFLAAHGGQGKVRVQCPEVEGNEKLIGQLLEVEVASLQDTVGELKERLSGVLGLPGNKMKLSREGIGFLRDEPSLAHYNIGPDVTLTLGLKERGRGKK